MQQYRDFYKYLLNETDAVVEDYPAAWNKEEFKNIQDFNGKLKYAASHLPKIASGSGRAVFKIDDEKALKIAKNKKGLAQNNVEAEPYIQNYEIVARTFDVGEEVKGIGPFWVEMELARKATPTLFRKITGVDIKELASYVIDLAFKKRAVRQYPGYNPEPHRYKVKMENNRFVQDLLSFAADYDMGYGDLIRLSSFGVVHRSGKEEIVLVDYGLTQNVFHDFYRVKM